MEEDAFGRCCVACMNRCADDCRRDPAICPGAPGAAECDGLRPAERRPADIDMEPIDIRPGTNNPLFPPTSAGRKTIGGLVRRRGTRRREAQVEPRRLRREAASGTDTPREGSAAKAS